MAFTKGGPYQSFSSNFQAAHQFLLQFELFQPMATTFRSYQNPRKIPASSIWGNHLMGLATSVQNKYKWCTYIKTKPWVFFSVRNMGFGAHKGMALNVIKMRVIELVYYLYHTANQELTTDNPMLIFVSLFFLYFFVLFLSFIPFSLSSFLPSFLSMLAPCAPACHWLHTFHGKNKRTGQADNGDMHNHSHETRWECLSEHLQG